jgi:hypothetical protein
MNAPAVNAHLARYLSDEWTLGSLTAFTWEAQHRFPWGFFDVKLFIDEGVINSAQLFSDALDADCIDVIRKALCGSMFTADALYAAILNTGIYADDVCCWLIGLLENQ